MGKKRRKKSYIPPTSHIKSIHNHPQSPQASSNSLQPLLHVTRLIVECGKLKEPRGVVLDELGGDTQVSDGTCDIPHSLVGLHAQLTKGSVPGASL